MWKAHLDIYRRPAPTESLVGVGPRTHGSRGEGCQSARSASWGILVYALVVVIPLDLQYRMFGCLDGDGCVVVGVEEVGIHRKTTARDRQERAPRKRLSLRNRASAASLPLVFLPRHPLRLADCLSPKDSNVFSRRLLCAFCRVESQRSGRTDRLACSVPVRPEVAL